MTFYFHVKAFIGQKYGFRPLPSRIAAVEFETILSELVTMSDVTDDDITLLKTWFKKDTNAVPHVYLMQPISSMLPGFTDMVGLVSPVLSTFKPI